MSTRLIHVVRQKHMYYSDIIEDRHYIYGFLNKKHALDCLNFLNSYKKRYSRYPCIEQKPALFKKYVSVDPIRVNTEPLEYIQNKCAINGAKLLGITDFVISSDKEVIISGTELTDELYIREEDIIGNLEYLFQN
jgi:hypothetical protein